MLAQYWKELGIVDTLYHSWFQGSFLKFFLISYDVGCGFIKSNFYYVEIYYHYSKIL